MIRIKEFDAIKLLCRSLSFFLLLSAQHVVSQKGSVHISGRITDQEKPSARIYAIKTKISFGDSLFVETDCDSSGYYSLYISSAIPRNFKTYLVVYQDVKKLSELFPPNNSCQYYVPEPNMYWTTRAPVLIEPRERLTDFKIDVALVRVIVERRPPCITFRKNTIEQVPCPGGYPDTTLYCLRNLLLKENTIVIKLVGHAWKESHPKQLALLRALMVKQKLIAHGIDSIRIEVAGKSDQEPVVNKKSIGQAKTKLEKEELISRNRTVDLTILSWDYDPVRKKVKNPLPGKIMPDLKKDEED